MNLTNIAGKIKTAQIMKKLGKGTGQQVTQNSLQRLPPGQRLLNDRNEFPVLDLGFIPEFNSSTYRFTVKGLIENPLDFSFDELITKFPKTNLTADFHCVTKWTQYDIKWGGIKFIDLVNYIKPKSDAKFVLQYGLDEYTTNVILDEILQDNVLLAYELDGKPLPPEHGWPIRMIIPHLYAWKGSKFLHSLEFRNSDEQGFWEVRGYHNHGDPWKEERYS